MTYVEHEFSIISYLLIIGLILVYGMLSIILIPIIVPLSRTAVHHCSRCLEIVGKKKFYGIPDFKQPVNKKIISL